MSNPNMSRGAEPKAQDRSFRDLDMYVGISDNNTFSFQRLSR